MKKIVLICCVLFCIVSFYFGYKFGLSVGIVSSSVSLLQQGASKNFVKQHCIDTHEIYVPIVLRTKIMYFK